MLNIAKLSVRKLLNLPKFFLALLQVVRRVCDRKRIVFSELILQHFQSLDVLYLLSHGWQSRVVGPSGYGHLVLVLLFFLQL